MKRKYKQLCLLLTMGIMGIGMITISFDRNDSKDTVETLNEKTAQPSASEKTVKITPTPKVRPKNTEKPIDKNAMIKNTDPAINELISSYYQAKIDCDEDKLKSLITDVSVLDINVISLKVQYIKDFLNFTCYTKPGIKDGDYVLYAVYDMDIVSIETYAPCVDELYITTKNGKPYIKLGNFSEDTLKLIESYREADDVKKLVRKVNENLQEAIASDGMLKQFYTNLIEQTNQKKSGEDD